jgi:dolichol-phosphate mannosyltransferase
VGSTGIRAARGTWRADRRVGGELLRFCAVGGVGFVVNLLVYSACIWLFGLPPAVAATCSFCVAVFNNYLLNRSWTYQGAPAFAGQGFRFFAISLIGLAVNLVLLKMLTDAGVSEVPAQVIAVILVTPVSFTLNKLWTFEHRAPVTARNLEDLRAVRDRPRAVCICVPTYNEAENVQAFVEAVLDQLDAYGVDGTVLVVDDASPDGTGEIADELAQRDPRVAVLHRLEKGGLGSAYQAGFRWALERQFDVIGQMDCDFSHDPRALPELLHASGMADLVIGSRYVPGGRVEDWPLSRRWISRGGSVYASTLLGVPIRDFTGGFKCFRREVLEQLPFESASARGYGFQIEMNYRAARAGFRVMEVPIDFRDRIAGQSKMSLGIAREAALLVLRLRYSRDPELRDEWSGEALVPERTVSPIS